jgi:hypothetical protein
MQQRFTGKVAIVTGSTSGIGEGIAVRLASEGAAMQITNIIASNDPGRLARSAYTYVHLFIVAGIIVFAVAAGGDRGLEGTFQTPARGAPSRANRHVPRISTAKMQ